MTLRETLEHVVSRGNRPQIFACIYNVYYKHKDRTFSQVLKSYNCVVEELQSLPKNTTSDLHLVIDTVIDGDQECMDVHLYDTVEDCKYSMDFVDWSELIDLIVEDKTGLSNPDQIAHILYELTFWGFTPDQIEQEKKILKEASKEPDDLK